MSLDITNHLIEYATVKHMLAKAWDEGFEAGQTYSEAFAYDDEFDGEPPPNPYKADA